MAKILIIEDNQTMCTGMQEILQLEGHELEVCFKGKEGMQAMKASAYDLIFCDMKLGDVSGLDVLKAHQEQKLTSKFIFITAFGNIELAVDCIKQGAFDFLPKPFSPDLLRARVKSYLN